MTHAEWQVSALNTFIEAVETLEAARLDPFTSGKNVFDPENQSQVRTLERDARSEATSAELALDQVMPDWRAHLKSGFLAPDELVQSKHLAQRAVALVLRQDDHDARGSLRTSPSFEQNTLHSWVWNGARKQWGFGQYERAVVDALGALIARIQEKTGYEKDGEGLFTDAFAVKAPPRPGQPRLRVLPGAHAANSDNRQEGALLLGKACIKAIRNPASHGHSDDLTQQAALEQLAMLSVLARWADEAVVERHADD